MPCLIPLFLKRRKYSAFSESFKHLKELAFEGYIKPQWRLSPKCYRRELELLGNCAFPCSLKNLSAFLIHNGHLQLQGEVNEVCGTVMGKGQPLHHSWTTAKWGPQRGTSHRVREMDQKTISTSLSGASERVERGQGPTYRLWQNILTTWRGLGKGRAQSVHAAPTQWHLGDPSPLPFSQPLCLCRCLTPHIFVFLSFLFFSFFFLPCFPPFYLYSFSFKFY